MLYLQKIRLILLNMTVTHSKKAIIFKFPLISTRNDLKICNSKKGVGIESEKVYKQVGDQIVWKQVEDTAHGRGRSRLLKRGGAQPDLSSLLM